MKNKILLSFALMLTLAMFSAVSVSATMESTPSINISVMNQDPDPVGPGRYVDVRFKIENGGIAIAEGVEIELVPEYPFSVESNEEVIRSLGDVPGYGHGRNAIVQKFKVRVDSNAIEGENMLHLRYKLGDSVWITQEYPISIRTIDATISIESVVTEPEKIRPGEPAKVKIKLKNMADSDMVDVSLKFDLGLSTVSLPATISSLSLYDSVPFAPLGSATEKKIKRIKPNEEVTFTYDIISYSNAEPRVYKIPIQIKYYDELGTEITKNDIVGLMVGIKPDLTVLIDETDLYVGKYNGEVSLRLINKGFTDVKFLDVYLEETDEFEILSPKEVYIGNVDSDDYETADFKIFIITGDEKSESKSEKSISLPISIEYKDANNIAYSDSMDIELKLYSAKKLGISNGNSNNTFLIILAVVVIGYFIYRGIRKKNRKK
ncbi:MAG: COG1361 S-layer family protein [Nanoarchaeota archaeon]|nr:COG1361 S-layer family protein [Nanoarchaeota archaeon]